MLAGLLVVALVVVVGVTTVIAFGSIRIVPEGQQAVVLRLGRFDRVVRPGPAFIPRGLDQYVLVETTPRRVRVPVTGYTGDGVRVAFDVALVAKVVAAPLVLRHGRTLECEAADATANVVAPVIGALTVGELLVGAEQLVAIARPRLDNALGPIGLGVESLRIGPVQLPAELNAALGATTVASRRHRGALVAAETARQVSRIATQARTEHLVRIDRVARRLDDRTLVLERLGVLQSAAERGAQLNVLAGLEDADVPAALPLPPPRLRDVS